MRSAITGLLLTAVSLLPYKPSEATCSSGCFFKNHRREAYGAMAYLDRHQEMLTLLIRHLGYHDARLALAVVMPEVSMYSRLEDAVQHTAANILYIREGKADYSLGCFQMKPSFAENIEQRVAASDTLKAKYPRLASDTTADLRTQRKNRLDRLMQTQMQCTYLAAFIDIVRQKSTSTAFEDDRQRVRHWATLYNGGLELSPQAVARLQRRKTFPRFNSGYSYADVAEDFYLHLNDLPH